MNFRITLFALAAILGIVFSIPSLLDTQEGKKVTLGLDLQGGLYMLLGVKTEVAIESKIKSIASTLRYFADDNDILLEEIKITPSQLSFVVFDLHEGDKIKNELQKLSGVVIKNDGMKYTITLTEEEIEATKAYAVTQAVDVIRNRLDQYGLTEPNVAKQGKDKILVELPGIKTADEEQRVRELIASPSNLQLMYVDEEKADQVYVLSTDELQALGDVALEDANNPTLKYLVKEIPIIDGQNLTDAKVGFDQNNQPVINFSLDSKGARVFGDFTGANVGKRLAIVLDNKVYSAPVIRERIGGGSGQISGGFSVEEAGSVAIALRSGALLAPVALEEKRMVGPSLGADSIRASLMALVSGFILVVLFMMAYYGLAGVIANVAVIVNLFIILAVMALFGATLTLPGMAGIVLHVGLAVDANIIINERIREQLRLGMGTRKAIEQGYEKAMRAILDSNVTQLLASTILYVYGTGAIKGFAVTLSMGILASMLTAIVGTFGVYQLFMHRIDKSKNYKLWFGMTSFGSHRKVA